MPQSLSYIIVVLCVLNHGVNTQFDDLHTAFPDDFLTPYKGHTRTKRSLRYVRDCQPVRFGNRTHEEFPASRKKFEAGDQFVRVHNLFYEYHKGQDKRQVYGHYSVVDDPLRTFSILEPENIGGCKKYSRETVAETSRQRHCVVATNAGFFRTKNGKCLGNLFSDGRLIVDADGVQNANFGIRKDGTIVTGYLSEEAVIDQENPFVQLVSGVIWLVRDGESFVNASKKIECEDLQETGTVDLFVNVISGRTAIGHDDKGRVVVVQVDGRTHHRGMNLYDFAEYLKKLGLVNAINLDGGGSATFVVNRTTVNYPSDKCGSFICPRKVSTITCFHEPDCTPNNCNDHGKCVMGSCQCDQYWTKDKCDVLDCSQSKCSLHGTCTEEGCKCFPGWTGRDCQKACPTGLFGANCTSQCRCLNGGTCDSKTGDCYCAAGFMGILCETECPPGRYGPSCAQVCNCTKSCECNGVTGVCGQQSYKHLSETYPWNNHSEQWAKCLHLNQETWGDHSTNLRSENQSMRSEYEKLLYWFIGIISLCAVSVLVNCILVYLYCQISTRRISRPRQIEFASDEEL